MRILIADDDFVSREKLRACLSPYGECSCVSNGRLAYEMFEKAHRRGTPFDLISMDINMPILDGHAVVREIRLWESDHTNEASLKRAKILMCSSSMDKQSVQISLVEGCEYYLGKPVTPEKIQRALISLKLLQAELQESEGKD